MSQQRDLVNRPVDIIELFFEDLSHVPLVNGQAEYLPLIRRIRRYFVMRQVLRESPADTLYAAMTTAKWEFETLSRYSAEHNLPRLNSRQLAVEIEPFIDNPNQSFPPTLSSILHGNHCLDTEDYSSFVEHVWQFVYLISLVPPELRSHPDPIAYPEAVLTHLQKIHREGRAARKRLVEGTMRYVTRIALTYIGRGIPYLDLVQEGYFGLWQATRTFREHIGAHFQSHAATWIHQRIGRYVAENRSTIRTPTHVNEKLSEFHKIYESFADQYGCLPNEDDLIDQLDWLVKAREDGETDEVVTDQAFQKKRLKKVRQWMQYHHMVYIPSISFESLRSTFPYEEDEDAKIGLNSNHLADLLIDPDSFNWQSELDISMLNTVLDEVFKKHLNEREVEILKLRFGMVDGIEYTLEEIGQKFGLTRERIRQIESKTIRKLQSHLHYLHKYSQSVAHDNLTSVANSTQSNLLHKLHDDLLWFDARSTSRDERRTVKQTMDRYIKRGRHQRRVSKKINRIAMSKTVARITILRQAIEAIGKPAHWRIIYDKACALADRELPFGYQEAYTTLFYHKGFQMVGDGEFGLASWGSAAIRKARQ